MDNPFRPSAGATPPDIIGRAGYLEDFDYGLRIGSGPGLLSVITGARGIGKTVMLGMAQDLARSRGWVVIAETATPGFMARIGESMRRQTDELGDSPEPRRRLTGATVAGVGLTSTLTPERQVDWRTRGETLLGLLAGHKTGLVITVDEIHAADRAELAQLAASVQHFIRDDLPIALVFAGLPAAVTDLLNEGVATFLRRADKIDLHSALVLDVEESFEKTFRTGGFTIAPDLIRRAAEATAGYPFLIQLVGYFLWKEAENASGKVDDTAVVLAIDAANRRHARTVIEAALSTASQRDLEYLHAMAEDGGPSVAGDIGRRIEAKPNLVANYRARLLAEGLIERAGRGKVTFAIPGLREHLRKHPLI